LLRDLIAFPTVSSDSNLAMVGFLKDRLQSAGASVEVFHDPTGKKANLFATIGPMVDGGIVLSGHCDVVPVTDQDWQSDPYEMDERDGKLFGRGTCDMKGFIAAAVTMAPVFANCVRDRPIHFAFTYDEETGCLGGQALIESLQELGVTPGVAIVGEPTEMRVIEGHKGCNEYKTRFNGSAGHGSEPDKGVNAVEYAVRYVSRILDLKHQLRARAPKNSPFDPPWTTINTGILTGGTAQNVIAQKATVEWEMRPVQDGDADFVKQDLQHFVQDNLLPAMQSVVPDSSVETEIIAEVVGLSPLEQNEARDIVMQLTGANSCDVVAFGTEAGLFQSLGITAVVCGPGSIDQAHKADEFVSLDQLNQCLIMLEKLAEFLGK